MTLAAKNQLHPTPRDWPSGGGACGTLVRSIDWSKSPLGAMEMWPAPLRSTLSTLLHSRHPMFLWWGPDLIQFYNDAYVPSFGLGKHPWAMGQRGRDCWREIWDIIGPQIDDVMSRGTPSWHEDHLVCVLRNDRLEEVYWTYGYSPVQAEDGTVGGTLVVCTETTSRVLSERRMRLLRALSEQTALALTAEEVLAAAGRVLAKAHQDIPFYAVYALDEVTAQLKPWRWHGLNDEQCAGLTAACAGCLGERRAHEPMALRGAWTTDLCGGAWPERPTAAFTVSLFTPQSPTPAAHIAFGLSARLSFDAAYRAHLLQIAQHLELALARVATYRKLEKQQEEKAVLLRELQLTDRAKDEFLAMLGHEMRNPLSPILSALHLMKQRDDGRSQREQAIIERQVGHLVRLLDDLLDVAKVARGKIALDEVPVEMADVVAKAAEVASELIAQRGHRLSVEVPSGLRVCGDPVRLAQVVTNLLTNAARYTEPGGLISVRAALQGGHAVLSVRDNGAGIAPEWLPRIFDLFVQGQRSTDRQEGGLGLGLALVKSLVSMHGGTVEASSEGLGKGSEFTLRIPATTSELMAKDEQPRASERPLTATKRVLIVDDNVDAAEMLGEVLGSRGYLVALAHDGEGALAMADLFAPEIALLDLGLPAMDGYELGRRLRGRSQTARCHIIALSGYGQESDRTRSRASGFDAHLVKPVDVERLLALLEQGSSSRSP